MKNWKMHFFSKIKKKSEGMAQGKQQLKCERNLSCHSSGMIATRTTEDGRGTNFDVMSSAEIVKQG